MEVRARVLNLVQDPVPPVIFGRSRSLKGWETPRRQSSPTIRQPTPFGSPTTLSVGEPLQRLAVGTLQRSAQGNAPITKKALFSN